jgi:hypothetical protein
VSGTVPSRRGRGRGQPVTGYPRPRRLHLPAAGARPEGGLPQPIPEAALYPTVARWLASAGFTCWRDVSYLGRWIDLYGVDGRGATVAVELKVADWRRALYQARLLRPAADRAYVGIWAPYVHRAAAASDDLKAAGVGLLSVNGTCDEVLEPATSLAAFSRWVVLPGRPSHRSSS